MITKSEPLSIPEVEEIINEVEEKQDKKEIRTYLKRFRELDIKKAKDLKQKIKELNILKIKPEHIANIINLVPQDEQDIGKIFIDVDLSKDETNKILETIKKLK